MARKKIEFTEKSMAEQANMIKTILDNKMSLNFKNASAIHKLISSDPSALPMLQNNINNNEASFKTIVGSYLELLKHQKEVVSKKNDNSFKRKELDLKKTTLKKSTDGKEDETQYRSYDAMDLAELQRQYKENKNRN